MYYKQDHMTMNTLLLLTLIFAGFQIQDNLAFGPGGIQQPIPDCWDGNKCFQDEHCGDQGECIGERLYPANPADWLPGLAFTHKSISFQIKTKITFIPDLVDAK